MKKRRLLFYCQPVLGMGHLVRSLAILRGLSDFEIWLVNGGMPLGEETRHLIPTGLHTIDLPPLIADRDFSEVRSTDPSVDLSLIRARRKSLLIETLTAINPDILLIELYPFGRLKFDFELRPLLETAQGMAFPPRIVCSLRDILVTKRDQEAFEQFATATANQFFDLILIHSDPDFQPLGETFPPVDRLTSEIRYTGYVLPSSSPTTSSPEPEVEVEPTIVVSIGGGRVGVELLEATIAASQQLHQIRPHRLRIFTGPYLPACDWQRLVAAAAHDDWISVLRFTPNLLEEMRAAALSISMAGYNTCLELLLAGTPSIVYPFTGNNNDEQTLRARKLEAFGVVKALTARELTPASLAMIIRGMIDQPPPRPQPVIDLEGARKTAQFLRELLT